MPTNDERRKIAAELRENRDTLTPYNLVDYIFDDPWNHDSGEEVAARLADLIEPEERTCNMERSSDYFNAEVTTWFCSECGSPIYNDVRPSYCLYCGAKVVDE